MDFNIIQGSGTATGTNTYAVTLTVAKSSYVTNGLYLIFFTNTNTASAPTLNINALGAKTLKNQDGSSTVAGDIANIMLLRYDGTDLLKIAISAGSSPALEFVAIVDGMTITPTQALALSEFWKGIAIDGAALDPSGTGADISAIDIDLSGVDLTNDPVMHGIEIRMPIRKDAIHIYEGQVVIDNTPDNTAASEFHGIDVRVDTAALVGTSAWAALNVTAVGASSGEVDAILARNEVAPLRQEVGTFVTPLQSGTAFAGREVGGVWTDGIDGNEIFVSDNDEIYIGAAAQFSQIEVIMTTPATKDVQPTFWYNTAADAWTQFFPDDETSGFQSSSLISWVPDSISGPWTADGNPDAGAATGYWIKIIRTRNADPGTPTPTTMKTGTVVTYKWDKDGNLTTNGITVQGQAYSEMNTLVDETTIATNCALGNVHEVTLTDNRTLGAPTNLKDGATYIWIITQDGGGTNTLAYNAVFLFPGGTAPVLSTGGGDIDILTGVSNGTDIYCSMQNDFS